MPTTSPVRPLHRLLVAAVSFSMAFPFAPVALAQVGQGDPPAAEAASIARQRHVLEGVLAELDPADFDVDALALDLAFAEPADIATFVADDIAYQTYRGLLRGPQGTLVARAGNALDQSVLLARLLTDAGYEARVALGTLDDDAADRLLAVMFEQAAGDAAETGGDQDAAATLAAITDVPGDQLEAGLAALDALSTDDLPPYRAALEARTLVLAALEGAGIGLGADVTRTLRDEARAYAWVEYRLSGAEPWSAAHPAFGSEAPPVVEAATFLEGSVPDAYLHKLRIEVTLERKRGEEFSTVALMEPWERPVANLLGVTIEIGNVPLGEAAGASLVELGTDLAEVAFFAPTLMGSLAPGAQAFDTLGNVVPPDAAASAMAGVFQTAAEKTNRATSALGALGGGPADEEPFAVSAEWVDFVLVAPGGEETRFRRFVFDRRTPEARATGGTDLLGQDVLLNGILTQQTVMVAPGALDHGYVASQIGAQAIAALDVLEAVRTAEPERAGAVLVERLGDVEVKDHLGLMASFDGVGASDGGVAYRAEPTIVVLRQAFTPGEAPSGAFGVDIVHNERRFLRRDGAAIAVDAEQAVLAGTWETSVERAYVQRYGAAGHGTYAAFEGVSAADAQVVAPYDVEALARLGDVGGALPALAADVQRGYAVIVATGTTDDAAPFAWWRVEPSTGATLGVAADGRGAESTEYSIPFGVSAAFAGALAVPGALACAAGEGGMAMALCFCDLAVTTGVSLALGFALAEKFAKAAIALFLIGDIGVGTVTAVPGLIPGPCSWVASEGARRPTCVPA